MTAAAWTSAAPPAALPTLMLRAGARRVYALDVGYNLLDYRIRSDDRVTVMERTNARFITPADFPESPSFAATDVSFISLKAILPAAFSVLAQDARFVALIKPQFEAPKELVGEKGVVRDTRRCIFPWCRKSCALWTQRIGTPRGWIFHPSPGRREISSFCC